jgi:hypothetical protein
MNTRLLVALGAMGLVLSTAAPAASATVAQAEPGFVVVAVCSDGSEWLGAAAPSVSPDESFVGSPLAILDAAALALPPGCDGLFLALPAPGAVSPNSGVIWAQDAAVWSRGSQPIDRALVAP